jgi:carboxyl-terminal processing protease
MSAAFAVVLAVACAGSPPAAQSPEPARPRAAGPAADPIDRDLALATFDSAWGRIARVHYDSSFNGVDWGAVRDELRPKVAAVATTAELRSLISDMLERLGESHYGLIPQEVSSALETPDQTASGGDPGDLGMEARLVDGRVVVSHVDADGPASGAGIRAGWVVETVDGRSMAEALERLAALPANEQRIAVTGFTYAVNSMLAGTEGDTAALDLRDAADRTVLATPVRRQRPGEPVRFGNLPTFFTEFEHERVALQGGGCVGVIRFSVWMLPVASAFDRAMGDVRDCEGVVIDVRGNPGGVAGMVMGIAGHFFDTPTALGILRQRGQELKLVANPRRVDTAGRPVEPFRGRLAVLTDEASVSTSEIFAAGLQTQGRARLFGDTTAGQALPAVASRLPNGDVLMYVIADLTGPDGRRIEGSGVAPDQVVPLTRAGLLAGRDAVLDAALQWIAGRPAASTTRTMPAGDAGGRNATSR